ncbi:TetR/AcrR family transcriptional regulator [Streptomonospora sp. S1-112]|uniref:TetR/AcrR family transcriptional regulator n=1 Tax=Streptomonospora mangrovi TaxID=2883123 RepID=A0A9X3NH45_9ACTN|nr:TetR/AcrR family transcriptional regulator [Streptomonospora mangrovi]MDA0563614.1 TetR/AcrR family transcriptional regulator [Streptomonospora mangrovi]
MASAQSADGHGGSPQGAGAAVPRTARRKARTRQALINAGRALIARKGDTGFSVQEITDEADVGLGSFYNHFADKHDLVRAAIEDVLEEHGRLLDSLTEGSEDPAAAFALAVRATARLGATHPELARILVRNGMAYLSADHGLAPRALADIRRGIEAGRFTLTNPDLGLAMVGGSLIALIHLQLEEPGRLAEDASDDLAEHVLTMFGVPADQARDLAHAPLPAPAATPAG